MPKKKLSDFQSQRKNANKHTDRGLSMLDKSIRDHGWIGAMTVANDGETFDGSARLETVKNQFCEDIEPIIVDSDGTRPIIVKRTDIKSADDPKAKKLAIAANQIASVDLDWDADILAEIANDVDISDMFDEAEIGDLFGEKQEVVDHQEPDFLKFSDNNDLPAYAGDRTAGSKQPIPIVVSSGTMKKWNEYKEEVGIKNDTAAFEHLLNSWTD